MKLAVGAPWSSPFMYTDWVDRALQMETPPGWDLRWFRGTGWCPARRHNHFCEQALAWGADLLLIIGADQLHPPDMFTRLVQRWEEGYEVVSALVPCRGYVSWQPMLPFQPMAWRFKPNAPGDFRLKEYRGMALDSDMVHVIDPRDGAMQRVNFIGSGVLMFHRDHLLALKKPWFRETIDPQNFQRLANQDCVFVWRLQLEAHAKVWVDTTIRVQHLHIFKIDETFSERFADWSLPGAESDTAICKYGAPPQTASLEEGRYLYQASQKPDWPHHHRLKIVLKWAGDLKGKRVLEVGSDDGTYLKAFSEAGAEAVVGCDPVRAPNVTLPSTVSFYRAPVESLNGIGDFEVVHLGEVLEHVDHPDTLLKFCTERWPDALFIVSVPNFWAKEHRRIYSWQTFKEQLAPYLRIEEEGTVRWQLEKMPGWYEWYMVRAKPKQYVEATV